MTWNEMTWQTNQCIGLFVMFRYFGVLMSSYPFPCPESNISSWLEPDQEWNLFLFSIKEVKDVKERRACTVWLRPGKSEESSTSGHFTIWTFPWILNQKNHAYIELNTGLFYCLMMNFLNFLNFLKKDVSCVSAACGTFWIKRIFGTGNRKRKKIL